MKKIAGRTGMSFLLFSPLLVCLQLPAGAAQPAPPAAPEATPAAPPLGVFGSMELTPMVPVITDPQAAANGSTENRIVFGNAAQGSEIFRQMQDRLADPEQRAALRAERLDLIRREHADMARVLGLDAKTERKVLELLADQQLTQLDRSFRQTGIDFDGFEEAQAMTKHLKAMRAVLGEARLRRFQDFSRTLDGRRQVAQLAEHLGAGNELRPDQEERLVELFHEQNVRTLELMRPPRWLLRSLRALRSPAEAQLDSQFNTIAANEESWRRKQAANRELEQQAAAFLTVAQLAELSKFQAQEQANLQRWIESARAQAGMDPNIPEGVMVTADAEEDTRKPIDGRVQVDLRVIVNRGEPMTVKQTVRNGESFTFEAADGLIVEATPTLYDDFWLDVRMSYYEQNAKGKRLLQAATPFGVQTRMPDGTPGVSGGSRAVVAGSKGYAVNTLASAKAL